MSDMPKIGCVQHDCDKCQAEQSEVERLKAELEEAKREKHCHRIEYGDLHDSYTELKAELATLRAQEPVGYVDYGDRVEWYGERPANETDLFTAPTASTASNPRRLAACTEGAN